MNIAGITITLNDGYKLKEWKKWYEEYKDELSLHIIVDNGSCCEYLSEIKSTFKNSLFITRTNNGACTIAYNDGIRKALEFADIDGIMLIGNDVRVKRGSITKLYHFLYSDEKIGIVSPICLMKDSMVVEDFGSSITKYLTMNANESGAGRNLDEILEEVRFTETVLGGCCLAKPEFYKRVGLQDEKLFMYSDEVDTGIRAKKAGYKLGFIKSAEAWHQHINPGNKRYRNHMAPYLINRNKVYLALKHFGISRAFLIFCFQCLNNSRLILKNIFEPEGRRYFTYGIKGSLAGLMGNMKNDSKFWE